jgi:hypothetical protein
MAALKLLADEFIRSAVTKIMPIMTPEITSSNRYRLTQQPRQPEMETSVKQVQYWAMTR